MPRTVLIVDDSEHCAATLEMALLPLVDVEIRSASTAWDALAFLDSPHNRIDAVVTDLDLPRMDGFELIERIRARPGCADLPILVISGDCHPDTPTRLRLLGVHAHVPKPYSPARVREILEHLLHARM